MSHYSTKSEQAHIIGGNSESKYNHPKKILCRLVTDEERKNLLPRLESNSRPCAPPLLVLGTILPCVLPAFRRPGTVAV